MLNLPPKAMAALVLLAAIAFAVSPIFTEPFSGFNPSQLPRPVDNPPIQPAGYAFAIWGVIYLWLILGAGYGLIKRAEAPAWQALRPALLVSLAIGTTWIPVALTAPVTATLLIIAMLITALIALFRAPQTDATFAAAPIALYAGWLSAASIVASATVFAAYTGINTTIVSIAGLILIGVLAGLVVRFTAHPLPYAAAVIWALVGVLVTNAAADNTFVLGGTLGILLVFGYRVVQRLRQPA